MNIIAWLLVGLVAGAVARLVIPGRQPLGCGGTIVLGLGGSLLGGWLATVVLEENRDFSPAGLLGSIIGAVLILLVLRSFGGRRF
jgi:uncharacterized membrane protein YeaQ/YmgE (transglycosylase-associated protein family)